MVSFELLSVSVTQDFYDNTWWVRAVYDADGKQFAALWPFGNEISARQFADDTEIVLVAGRMTLEDKMGEKEGIPE